MSKSFGKIGTPSQYLGENEQGHTVSFTVQFNIPKGNNNIEERLAQYHFQVNQNMNIFRDRNEAYGDAFLIGGVAGCVHELLGCIMKLVVLSLKAPLAGRANKEKVTNALRDTANFATMALILIALDRWDVKL